MSLKSRGGEAVPISTYMSLKYDWAGLGVQKRTQKLVGFVWDKKGRRAERQVRGAGGRRAFGVRGISLYVPKSGHLDHDLLRHLYVPTTYMSPNPATTGTATYMSRTYKWRRTVRDYFEPGNAQVC